MVKEKLTKLVVAFLFLFTVGCIINPLYGTLYTDVYFHMGDYNQTVGPKSGESCVTNILGVIATGDASVKETARKAGITKVTSIDYKMTNILGLFGTFCIKVTGE